MKKTVFLIMNLVLAVLIMCPLSISAQELKPIRLLNPQLNIGRPLMQVLNDRRSMREFSSEKLSIQVLSNLLWAAWGINRRERGLRTAPSAANFQEIDIYVAMEEGLYLYDADTHMLEPIIAKDIRAETGTQSFVKDAPMNLVYVADYSRMRGTREGNEVLSAVHTGYISQNVYLFCASEGLATVVRGLVDKPTLKKVMNLRPDQHVTFGQSVGYPKK
ncbi:SagB/ThcOx family dehydrogenase [Candidatus Latescibacterota bacterium]